MYLILSFFLILHVWIYFNVRQSNEENFKKWAIPLAIFDIIGMILINILSFFYVPIIVLMFPLHLFAVILAICNSFMCMDCGKRIDKDTDLFSRYKRCTICKANENVREI